MQRLPTGGFKLAGDPASEQHKRHLGRRDGPREDYLNYFAAGVPGGGEGHLGPSFGHRPHQHSGQLGDRVEEVVSCLECYGLFRQ